MINDIIKIPPQQPFWLFTKTYTPQCVIFKKSTQPITRHWAPLRDSSAVSACAPVPQGRRSAAPTAPEPPQRGFVASAAMSAFAMPSRALALL